MDIKRSTEVHFGIEWEKYEINSLPPTFFRGTHWCIEFNKDKDCWELWRSLDLLFNSTVLTFVLMVARELVFENLSEQFIPMWERP